MKDALSNKQADDWLCVKPKPSKLPTKYKNSQKYLFLFSKISEFGQKSRNPSKMIIFVKKTYKVKISLNFNGNWQEMSDFLKWTIFITINGFWSKIGQFLMKLVHFWMKSVSLSQERFFRWFLPKLCFHTFLFQPLQPHSGKILVILTKSLTLRRLYNLLRQYHHSNK